MARILSVRTRTIRALQAALMELRPENGWDDVNVRHVEVPSMVHAKVDDPDAIHIIPGKVVESIRSTGSVWADFMVHAYLYRRLRTNDPDGELEYMASAVKRRLMAGIIDDSSQNERCIELISRPADGRGMFEFVRFMDPPTPMGPISGVLTFSLLYSYNRDDDRLWDTDDEHVTE